MNAPTTFRAGDSTSWSESLPDYLPADGWSLNLRLLWSSGGANIPTTPSGDEYAVSLTGTETANWPAGPATLVSQAVKGADKITLGSQAVTILPDLMTSASHDGRSANRKALEAAEAALAAYLTGGQAMVEEYEIAGRRMKFRSADEITKLINFYKPLVAKENAALALLQGGGAPGRVYYRG